MISINYLTSFKQCHKETLGVMLPDIVYDLFQQSKAKSHLL